MLNLGGLLGPGIFAVSGVILSSVGSVGLLLVFWLIAPMFSIAATIAYGELASMFPDRSGGEVVYLEKAYPRPRFFVPVSFAVTSVLLSFSGTSSVLFAQYMLAVFDLEPTTRRQTIVALVAIAFGVGVVAISTKWALRIVNILTTFKILSLVFVATTGIAVLAGLTRIKEPYANFQNLFADSTPDPNALATALIKVNWAYYGWQNGFNVLSEIRSPRGPARAARLSALVALAFVTGLFLLVNVAYIAAVPKEEIKASGELVASLFFQKVYGDGFASKLLPLMVALSCIGNITVGKARILREVARQGLLPFPQLFASTRPFGTPLGPALLKFCLSAAVLLALPARDAFNFLLDLASYPQLIFNAATAVGIWVLRRRRNASGLSPALLRAPDIVLALWFAQSVFSLVMPWVPPKDGKADVSFWYATYCLVGLGILATCGLYYYVWIVLLPRLGGYTIVEEVLELPGGARTGRLVRKYPAEVAAERAPLLGDSA
ncbi:amino acid/polyamine transporter I [Vararia minispora EC-137]|uniref:Amino acid/polyamine transporter I n=1 Tax=Vararia minispora EC-137 TaxID=1314806 RepID=A0ACB8QMK4_9AGAM|nr:amino acid/polyamine transporter I [Vararia minispora EC-137]